MKKQDGFYFEPKKWLGDAHVIAMDWDCKGMYLHLMALAWQQPLKGHLLDDDKLLCKLLGNPDSEDWNNRIKPQIFNAWKKKIIKEHGAEKQYWYQPGLLKTVNDMSDTPVPVKKARRKKNEDILMEDAPQYDGFDLKVLLKAKDTTTILYQPITKEESITIWTLGSQLLCKQNESDSEARKFLARQITQFGEKQVAEAITQLSLKRTAPADIKSYLIGILKKQQLEQIEQTKKTGRGSVSL